MNGPSSSGSRVRIVIIGAGLIGPRHAQAVLDSPNAELVAIVDPLPASQKIATEFGASYYPSVTMLLESAQEKPDAAIICTPNSTHVSIGMQMVVAGIHILVEKPISTDVDSGRELIDLARKLGVKILVGHHRRFNSYVVAAEKAISAGELGTVVAVNGLWTIQKPEMYFDGPGQWRRQMGSGGGPVLINLIHEIDILHHLIGPVVKVYAEQVPSRRGFDAEEGAAVTLRFQSGAVGTFLLCDNVVSPHSFEAGTGENPTIPKTGQDFYRIFGTEGTLSVPDLTKWSYGSGVKCWNEEMRSESIVISPVIPFRAQIEHFIDVIRGRAAPSCSGEVGLAALIVCESIKNSMSTGAPVEIRR